MLQVICETCSAEAQIEVLPGQKAVQAANASGWYVTKAEIDHVAKTIATEWCCPQCVAQLPPTSYSMAN